MRFGTVAGRVTLASRHPKLKGERLLLTLPWSTRTLASGGKEAFEPSIVVLDVLGAGVGDVIAIAEGREAACPCPPPEPPIDAYCACLVDEWSYEEKDPRS